MNHSHNHYILRWLPFHSAGALKFCSKRDKFRGVMVYTGSQFPTRGVCDRSFRKTLENSGNIALQNEANRNPFCSLLRHRFAV